MTTQGRFKDFTISMATDVFPDPELPAMPMMLKSAHGGAYCRSHCPSVAREYTGGIDSIPLCSQLLIPLVAIESNQSALWQFTLTSSCQVLIMHLLPIVVFNFLVWNRLSP